jgi:nucleotide-binding universal stress UspA family protein
MEAPRPFTCILSPIDGSACSINAGQLAIELAAAFRARIVFVYVVDTATVEELARVSRRPLEGIEQEMEANGQRYLHHLAQQASMHSLESQQTVRHGVPYTDISELAKEQRADLIVIGQVGRHGPRRLMMGSVTERVIELAPCPVLVVKPE